MEPIKITVYYQRPTKRYYIYEADPEVNPEFGVPYHVPKGTIQGKPPLQITLAFEESHA